MKRNTIRLVCLLLAAVMAFGLAGCGKEKTSFDPNHFVIGDYELQYKGACLMTDTDGKDSIVLTLDFTNNSKEDAVYLWSVFEKAVQNGAALEGAFIYVSEESYEMVTDAQFTDVAPGETLEVRSAYTLNDTTNMVEITFSDLLEKYKETLTLDPTVLVREGTPAAEPTGTGTAGTTPEGTETDALLEWWNGDWYGWWTVSGADGAYADWSGRRWECCANFSIGADYTGTEIIWDEDLPKDNAVSEAAVTLNAAGTGEHGTLYSEEGYFMDGDLAHADWIVDPALITYDALMNYDNMICIDAWYEVEDGGYKYNIYLRPWGMTWDDVAPENRPASYDTWYLPLIEAGLGAPDTVGGEPDLSGAAPAATEAPEATAVPEATAAPETAAGDGDYGKSNPDAVGIARLEDMQALYKICFESRTNGYHVFSYEDARDMLGCDGVVRQTASYTWNESKHTYRWVTEDGKDYFNISFTVEGDEEWYESCNMSENVINGLW